MERQRQHIARLRVAHHAAAGDVSLPPRPNHVVVQCFVLPHVLAQRAAHAPQQLRGIGVVGARDQPLVGRALVAALRRVQPQPVAKVRAAQPQELFLARAVHIVHPSFHDGEMLFKQLFVAVGAPNFIRHDARRITPGGRRLLFIKMRNDPIDRTVLALLERHILHPLGEKALNIEVDSPRAAKHLRIARPAETLVPLRTVGGDVEIVTLLRPQNIVIELIDLLIAAHKIAGARHVRMYRHGGEGDR